MTTNNDRNPALCRVFIKAAKDILSRHADLKHSWSIDADEDHCILDFPKQSENGFDITVEVYPHEIVVSTDGPHIHFDDKQNIEGTVQDALGLVRDLLSPSMRVVEKCSNGKPYRWNLEVYRNSTWIRESTTGIIFYNFFGKKTTKMYQNNTLPSRSQN